VRDTGGYYSDKRHYFCPVCNVEAKHMGVGNLLTPFWLRLPKFFLYPLQPVPLVLTLVLAFVGAIFNMSIIIQTAIWIVMMKYAYAVLINTGRGSLRAPAVTWEMINNDIGQVFKQFVIFFIIGVAATLMFSHTGAIGGFSFLAVAAVFIPAMIMVLVATNSVTHALNPMIFVPIVSRIGGRYFLMYLFLLFLYSAPSALFAYFPFKLPFPVWKFIALFFNQYYSLVSYHLMGYVLLQYNEEIGYHVDYEHFMDNSEKGPRKEVDDNEKLLNNLGVLVQKGRYDDALALIRSETGGKFENIELSDRYLQLLRLAGEKQEVFSHGRSHLDLLVQQNKKQKAVDLYEQLAAEGCPVKEPNTLFVLAGWLKARREYKRAFKCYADYVKNHKEHEYIPEAYFELAKLFHEQGKNSAKAQNILKKLIHSFPDHSLAPKAKAYLAAIS